MRLHVHLLAALGAALLQCAACVSDPYDGQIISSSPTTTIRHVGGYTTETGTIGIYAKNSSSGWEQVATATVNTGMSYPWAGLTWYPWSVNDVQVPSHLWRTGPSGANGGGARATLKASTPVGDYVSLSKPWGSCFDPNQTIEQFLTKCMSSRSPQLDVLTCGAFGCGGEL
jgi:hypothetical protein